MNKRIRKVLIFIMLIAGVMFSGYFSKNAIADEEAQYQYESVEGNDNFIVTTQINLYMNNDKNTYSFIKVKNLSDKHFLGYVKVYCNEYSNFSYESKLDVQAEDEVEIRFPDNELNCLFNPYSTFPICVVIENESGKQLFEKNLKFIAKNGNKVYADKVAVLTEQKNGFNYLENDVFEFEDNLKNNTSFYGHYVEYLDDIPKSTDSISLCKYLIISNYDTSKLTKQQIDTIKEYVGNGAILIVGTGSSANKTLSGLNSLIKYTYKGVRKCIYNSNCIYFDEVNKAMNKTNEQQIYEYFTNSYNYSDMDLIQTNEWEDVWHSYYKNDKIEINKKYEWVKEVFNSDGKIIFDKENANTNSSDYCDVALLDIDNSVSSYGIDCGKYHLIPYQKGYIAVFNVDLSDEIVDFDISVINDKIDENYIEGDSTKLISNDRKINKKLFVFLMLIYVALISVGLYLILKKIDKRNLYWSVVGCMAFLFCVIFCIVSNNSKFDDMLGYVKINNYSKLGNVYSTTDLSVINVTDSDYEFDVNTSDFIRLKSIMRENNSYYYEMNGLVDGSVDFYKYYNSEHETQAAISKYDGEITISPYEGRKTIKIKDMIPYSMSTMSFQGASKTSKSIDLVKENDDWYIVNNLGKDIYCVNIKTDYGYIYIGDLSANEKVNLINYVYQENVGYKTYMNDFIDKKKALFIDNQYSKIVEENIYDNVLILAVEDTTDNELSDEWEGITIAVSMSQCDEDIIEVPVEKKIKNSMTIIGEYSFDYFGEDNSQGSNKIKFYECYGDVVMLYTVNDECESLKINYDRNYENRSIEKYMEQYNYDSNDNMNIYVYNYSSSQYETLFKLYDYSSKELNKDYYGDGKPLRLYMSTQSYCPIPYFEMEVGKCLK